MGKKYAIVLSGGTALVAVQVPVILGLIERLGRPSAWVGTSGGAIHALVGASRREDELPGIWNEVGQVGRGWFMRFNADLHHGLTTLKPLRRQMEKRGMGLELHEDCRVGVTDLTGGHKGERPHRLIRLNQQKEHDDRLDAVVCSSTQPAIHEGWKFKGKLLHDGGVLHVLPTMPDHDRYDEVHAIFASPVGPKRDRPRRHQHEIDGALEAAFASVDLWIDRIVDDDVQRAIDNGWHVYAPRSWRRIGRAFDASEAVVEARMAEGRWMLDNPWSVPA